MSEKKWMIVRRLLIIASILASLKIIFFDYTMDEEYQIVMAYRYLQGDSLFLEMWEPHQTSAFMCIGLMGIYHLVTGTYTGVIIFLRFCTTIIQLLFAVWGYKIFKKYIDKKYAFLLAIAYFNFVPKNIQIPEFSNMQVWFFGILILSLIEYYSAYNTDKSKWWWLIFSGIGMALEVLAYPSCILLFPFILFYIIYMSKETRWRDGFFFGGTCVVSAVIWVGIILKRVPLKEFIQNIKNVFGFDLTHKITGDTQGKVAGLGTNVLFGSIFLIIILMLSYFVYVIIRKCQKKQNINIEISVKKLQFLTIAICVSEVIQIIYWVVLQKGFEFPHIHVVVIIIATFVMWKEQRENGKLFIAGIWGTLISYVAVIYISDLQMYNALPHGAPGIVLCILVLVIVWSKHETEYKKSDRWIFLLLIFFCATVLVGKGYTFRAGRNYDNVFETRGIMKNGPAAGILSDYMFAYIYNCNYEDFQMYVPEEEKILMVTNLLFSAGTTPYMFNNSEICHYSIVDPTAYDERLVEYWKLYPQKAPNVIVVDCWYGQLMELEDSFILDYIENEFEYSKAIDGRYVRFYIK